MLSASFDISASFRTVFASFSVDIRVSSSIKRQRRLAALTSSSLSLYSFSASSIRTVEATATGSVNIFLLVFIFFLRFLHPYSRGHNLLHDLLEAGFHFSDFLTHVADSNVVLIALFVTFINFSFILCILLIQSVDIKLHGLHFFSNGVHGGSSVLRAVCALRAVC